MTDGAATARIVGITLDEHTVVRRNPDIEHERAIAIFDLLEDNLFRPCDGLDGPFHLHLSIEEGRLALDIETPDRRRLDRLPVPLASLKTVVRDYFMVCESYYDAIKTASLSRIEAIDMGRRALHNEGAALLQERLADRVEIDTNTARRLFTLICVLHIR